MFKFDLYQQTINNLHMNKELEDREFFELKQTYQLISIAIKDAQISTFSKINKEKIKLCFEIGKVLSEKTKSANFGDGVLENFSKQIQIEFKGIKGFSSRNLFYMKKFFEVYSKSKLLQPLVAEISWSHNILILDKCNSEEESYYYIQKSIQNTWSKLDLKDHLQNKDYQNTLLNQNNFKQNLKTESIDKYNLIIEFKDDYGIDLVDTDSPLLERDLENTIVNNIEHFLDQLGGKMAFVGRQVKVNTELSEYFIDLLFFHINLNCYVAFELKVNTFKPEYLGQLQGYLALLNQKVKSQTHNPSIGILLCRDKDRLMVEYMLAEIEQPIGVSTYSKVKKNKLNTQPNTNISKDLLNQLPTKEEIEKGLSNIH